MATAAKIVKAVQFRTPVDICGGLKPYVGTGAPGWPGWNLYADYTTREILVAGPTQGDSRRRIRVPFENVLWYEPGLVAPKSELEGFAPSDES